MGVAIGRKVGKKKVIYWRGKGRRFVFFISQPSKDHLQRKKDGLFNFP